MVLPGGAARGGCAGTGGRGASGGVAALQRVRALRNARRAARYARGPTAARLGHASRPLRLEWVHSYHLVNSHMDYIIFIMEYFKLCAK